MKVGDVEVNEDLYYHNEHCWTCIEKGLARFGISDYGQKGLIRICAVELPELGTEIHQNKPYGGLVLLNGAVFELIAPLSGIVKEINENIQDNPPLISKDPYGEGWLVVVDPSNLDEETKNLMDCKCCVEFYRKLMI